MEPPAREFYPLTVGNRWTSDRKFTIDIEVIIGPPFHENDTYSATVEHRIIGTEEIGGVDYLVEETRLTVPDRPDVLTRWTRFRQDHAGLYVADVPADRPPVLIPPAVSFEGRRPLGAPLATWEASGTSETLAARETQLGPSEASGTSETLAAREAQLGPSETSGTSETPDVSGIAETLEMLEFLGFRGPSGPQGFSEGTPALPNDAMVDRHGRGERLPAHVPSIVEQAWRDHVRRLDRVHRVLEPGIADPQTAPGRPGGLLSGELLYLAYPLHPKSTWFNREEPFLVRSVVETHEVLDLPAGRFPSYRLRVDNEFLDPEDRVLMWYSPCGRVAFSIHTETMALDIETGETARITTDETELLRDLSLVDPRGCGEAGAEGGP